MKLRKYLRVVPTLRISGATRLLLPHTFMAWTGQILKHNKSVPMLMFTNIKILFCICTKFIIEDKKTVKYTFMEMSNLHLKLLDIL
jgi:hypothetical protein